MSAVTAVSAAEPDMSRELRLISEIKKSDSSLRALFDLFVEVGSEFVGRLRPGRSQTAPTIADRVSS